MQLSPSVALFFVLVAGIATAQSGQYMGPTGAPMEGSYIIPIEGADQWLVGTNNTVRLHVKDWGQKCNDLVIFVYVGTVFWSITLQNQYACHCSCYHQGTTPLGEPIMTCCMHPDQGGDTYPEPGVWRYRHIYPFSIAMYDTTTSAEILVPSRENAPKNMPLESLAYTIPSAFDKRYVTAKMKLNVTFIPRETILYTYTTQKLLCGILPCLYGMAETDWSYDMERNSERSLGFSFKTRFCHNDHLTIHGGYYLERRAPVPSMIWKIRRGRMITDYNPGEYANDYSFLREYIGDTYGVKAINMTAPGKSWSYVTEIDVYEGCQPNVAGAESRLVVEFYENRRTREATGSLELNHLRQQLTFNPDKTYELTLTGTHPLTLRIQWTELTHDLAKYPQHGYKEVQETWALFVVQPYAMQDLWIDAYDAGGNRIFLAVERHIPYRREQRNGLIGYFFALRQNLHNSNQITIRAKWNRRRNLGTMEEEKAALLRDYVVDDGGHADYLNMPIPRAYVPIEGTMGALASATARNGDVLAHVKWRSLITSNMSWNWFERSVQPKINDTEAFFQAFWNNTDPYHREMITLTMFLITRAASPIDNVTQGWVYMDSYYPPKPKMLPHFFERQTLQRLYGHTALVELIDSELEQWASEYAAIGKRNFSWWYEDVDLEKYQWMRGHVRRSALFLDGDVVLVPFVNFLRHAPSGTHNCEIVIDKWLEQVEIVATTDIAENEEVIPDFDVTKYSKHEFLLKYGEVPEAAQDSATIPGYDGILLNSWESRNEIILYYQFKYGDSYRDALERFKRYAQDQLDDAPKIIDGLGASPEMVVQAARILKSERTVLDFQKQNTTDELDSLPEF